MKEKEMRIDVCTTSNMKMIDYLIVLWKLLKHSTWKFWLVCLALNILWAALYKMNPSLRENMLFILPVIVLDTVLVITVARVARMLVKMQKVFNHLVKTEHRLTISFTEEEIVMRAGRSKREVRASRDTALFIRGRNYYFSNLPVVVKADAVPEGVGEMYGGK